jgi:outer membrane protein assembly factor BamB
MKVLRIVLGAALAGGVLTSVRAQQAPRPAPAWSQFRGPGGLGVSAERLPTTWSAEQGITWKTRLPGPGASGPVVFGGKVFLTAYTGYGLDPNNPGDQSALRRHVLCLSEGDGKLLWSREVPSELPEQPWERRMHAHGYASSTMAADGQRVYAFFGKSGVVALDHAGKQLWLTKVGSRIHEWGSGASVVLHGDLVIVNASVESGSVVALNRATGAEVWRAGDIREAWNTPLLADAPGGRKELVVPVFGQVLGLDPATGQRLWSCEGVNSYMVASPVAAGGVAYVIGGRDNGALAVRLGGRGDVTGSHRLWRIPKGANVPSPLYHEGHVYWVNDRLGTAVCADARTGAILYEERLGPRPGEVWAAPLLADGKIYYVSKQSGTFVVAAKPQFQQLACNVIAGDRSTFNGSPAVSRGRLLLRSDQYLYAVGP